MIMARAGHWTLRGRANGAFAAARCRIYALNDKSNCVNPQVVLANQSRLPVAGGFADGARVSSRVFRVRGGIGFPRTLRRCANRNPTLGKHDSTRRS